ncbi:TPA: hypothetical protein IAB95_05210 [Candidatus Ventrenecus avicola]|nr:hypothetical protein [Candidatus Ventrenecus avicola]
MNNVMLEHIMDVLPTVLEKNKKLFKDKSKKKDWYHRRKYFLDKNSKFLYNVRREVKEKYDEDYSEAELFAMQKLYLLYPDTLPKKLLSLPWEIIKIILNLYSIDKRKFYTDLALEYQWDESKLEFYILNDLYEKYLGLIQEINDYHALTQKNVIPRMMEIQTLLYEEL